MDLWTLKPNEILTFKPNEILTLKPAKILTLKQIILINDYKLDGYPLINDDTIFDDIRNKMKTYTTYTDYSMFSDDDAECTTENTPIGFSFYKDGFFQIIYNCRWSDGWGGDTDYYYLDLDVNAFYTFMKLGFKKYHRLNNHPNKEYFSFDNIHKVELKNDIYYDDY